MKFVIEHLEPKLYNWCLIEYEHISKIVGKKNLIFTNIKNKKEQNKLRKYGIVYQKSISDLDFKNICVLSHYSKKTLAAKDKDEFQYFVFGGILGDAPAKKRTLQLTEKLQTAKNFKRIFGAQKISSKFSRESKIKFETRNLGDKQMPTDTAVYAAKKILEGKKLNDFKFVDKLEIEVNENGSMTLPFRYVVDNNKLIINEKLVEYLRKRKEF